MIKMLRVDERLIHGQVAVSWSKVLKITHIVLINKDVVNNDMQKMTLKMAVPAGIKLAIKNVEKGIKLLKDPRTEKMRILIVVKNPQDALSIAKEIDNIELINLGNYGLLPNGKDKPKKQIANCIVVDEDDMDTLKKIGKLGVPFEAQLTPDAPKKDMNKLMREE